MEDVSSAVGTVMLFFLSERVCILGCLVEDASFGGISSVEVLRSNLASLGFLVMRALLSFLAVVGNDVRSAVALGGGMRLLESDLVGVLILPTPPLVCIPCSGTCL